MTSWPVRLTARAERDAEEAWFQEHYPDKADSWWNGLVDAILTLEEFSERCPVARESAYFRPKIRQRLYEDHRILFTAVRARRTRAEAVEAQRAHLMAHK